MRRDSILGGAFSLLVASAAISETPGPSGRLKDLATPGPPSPVHSIFSPSTPTPVTGVEPLVVGTATDFAAAAVSTSKDGTQFKATIVPVAAFDLAYRPFVSDMAVTISTDSSNSLTRATFSTGYNPFSLRGSRGQQAINQSLQAAQCGTLPVEAAACKTSCAAYTNADQKKACEAECDDALSKALKTCNARRAANEWSYINDTWIPALGLSASADFYPTGTRQDPNSTSASSQSLNGWGGFTLQASLSFRPGERMQADLYGSLKPWWRPSGDPSARMARYFGGGATLSWLFYSFLDRGRPEQTPDYLKSGFIPGVAVGASLQALSCTTEDTCNKGRTSQYSVTPFIEVRVKAQLQVRFSVPVAYYKVAGGDETALAPSFTIGGVIGAP